MTIREAKETDIPTLHRIRIVVNENVLSDPNLISHSDYSDFLFTRDKGWLVDIDNTIVGFAICDLKEENIWALFVHPDFEKRGIASMSTGNTSGKILSQVDVERMVCMEKKFVLRLTAEEWGNLSK